jgi:hypothetical protein
MQYIYIYICVCVCVRARVRVWACVRARRGGGTQSHSDIFFIPLKLELP